MQRGSSGIWAEGRCAVQARFDFGGKVIECSTIGPASAAGRHHACFDLAYDFLPDRRVFFHVVEVHGIEHQVGGLQALVVTGDAVLSEERGCALSGGNLRNAENDSQDEEECLENAYSPPREEGWLRH